MTDRVSRFMIHMEYDEDIGAKIRTVRQEIAALETKRSALMELLERLEAQAATSQPPARVAEAGAVYQPGGVSGSDIRRFMELFQGRTDVFPERWESRTGRSGYSPVCRNEWVQGVCRKPRVKCAECDAREFVPLTPLPSALVQSVEEAAARKGRVVGVRMSMDDELADRPWMIPPSGRRKAPVIQGTLPANVAVVCSNLVFVEKEVLPSGLINRIVRLAAFQNPEFYQAQAMRLSTFGKPRIISCAEEFDKHIALPRGCYEELKALFDDLGVRVETRDRCNAGSRLDVSFHGELKPEQEDAVDKILEHDTGVLSAPTAFGKTVVAAKLIAERGVNTLVLVHRKQLLDQWRARLATFLAIKETAIGQVGGGKKSVTGTLDVAMLQSLSRKGSVEDIVAEYGHVVVDECHHISAFKFELVLRQVKAKYVTGLTATPVRKDGHHPIIFMQCGPIRWSMSPRTAARDREFEHRVVVRETGTVVEIPEEETKIHDVHAAILADKARMKLIAEDVLKCLADGRSPLILTERRHLLDALAKELRDVGAGLFILHGGLREKERREVVEALRHVAQGEQRALLATGKYIGEGFDDARLDTLFLTSPISWRGILQQYAGRLHRAHYAKESVIIYDYVDVRIPMARRMFERRKKGYASLGYVLEDLTQEGLGLG